MKNIKVLIVVPDKPEQIKLLVEQSDCLHPEIDIVKTVAEGIKHLEKNKYDIILLDPELPNGQGIKVYEQIHAICKCAPIIVISDNEIMTSELVKAGAQDNHFRTDLTKHILNKSIQYAVKRKEVERKLRNEKDSSKKLYDTLNVLFNCASDIIWSKDANNRYDLVNNAFLKILNMKKSDIIGKTLKEILVNANDDITESDAIIMKTQKPHRHVQRVFLNDGALLWWDVTKSPVFNSEGDITGVIGTARDITEKVETEERIRKQLDSKIMDRTIMQDKNMAEIRNKIADTVKQIDGFKETLDEYNRR